MNTNRRAGKGVASMSQPDTCKYYLRPSDDSLHLRKLKPVNKQPVSWSEVELQELKSVTEMEAMLLHASGTRLCAGCFDEGKIE
jgi:hypothetical protein